MTCMNVCTEGWIYYVCVHVFIYLFIYLFIHDGTLIICSGNFRKSSPDLQISASTGIFQRSCPAV